MRALMALIVVIALIGAGMQISPSFKKRVDNFYSQTILGKKTETAKEELRKHHSQFKDNARGYTHGNEQGKIEGDQK